jgi:hypothetical protein
MKYPPSLCHRCNTTVSQPWDEAYDTFVRWLENNEATVLRRRFIDFQEIYGQEFEAPQRNLYKYFAKSFGCRLVAAGFPVPVDVVQLLGQDSFQTMLLLTFAVNEDVLIMPLADRRGFIGKGDLIAWASRQRPDQLTGYTWDEHVSWFWICHWYNAAPDRCLGSTWVADSQFLYLGSFAPRDADTRAEAVRKAALRTSRG